MAKTRKKVQASTGKAVVFERVCVRQRLQVQVTDPEPPVPFWPVFINRLHTFCQCGEADSIDAFYQWICGTGKTRRNRAGRSCCFTFQTGNSKIKIRGTTQQLDGNITK